MRIVVNTSPLILLAKIERLDLLKQLYEITLVPEAVRGEIEAKPGRVADRVGSLIRSGVFQLHSVEARFIERLTVELGKGERETIALALETHADLVVIDDLEGRQFARNLGLPLTGTIGVLVEARERKLISSIRLELDHLIEAGMWLDEVFYHRILNEFSE